jgi:glycosyltransferase involved in cell wall biosynthesis
MKIAYLLEDTELAGGIRVAVAHADALTGRGHEAVLVTKGGPLTWRRSRARWQHVASFEEIDAASFDFVVGTFWKTLAATYAIAGPRAVHFCQGYEGSFTAYQPFKAAIDEAYRLPIPKITVSPHLVEICRTFYDDATYVGQIVDEEFYQTSHPAFGHPLPASRGEGHSIESPSPRLRGEGARRADEGACRVLLVGPMQADFKGIDIGYAAVRRARARGARFDLIRISQWAAAEGEPAELASEFHVALTTAEMAKLIASCDVFLGPSRQQEGFGLPAAEALASGVPAVLSEIPSFLSWDAAHDYALFASEAEMGDALVRLLGDRALRERLSRRGRQVVEQFRAENTGARLEAFFQGRCKAQTQVRQMKSSGASSTP